jgi:glutamine amidotransferase
MKVGVIDYGVGNLGSVLRALDQLGVAPLLLTGPAELARADRLLLPGVGNFSDCAELLARGGWVEPLREQVHVHSRPLLGVCVGMQLLASASMEGASGAEGAGTAGLGLVPGTVRHLRRLGCNERVPHVGWNAVTPAPDAVGLFDGIPAGTDFYFVHSYAFEPSDAGDVLATTHYGVEIAAAVRRGCVWGTQFHPEKSSRAGFRLLQNFIGSASC